MERNARYSRAIEPTPPPSPSGTMPLRSLSGTGLPGRHVNGWPVIAAALKARGLRQKDLAAHLKVSPPAVSQMKTGRILLNARHLAALCDFLKLDAAETRALYGEIVEARLGRGGAALFGASTAAGEGGAGAQKKGD